MLLSPSNHRLQQFPRGIVLNILFGKTCRKLTFVVPLLEVFVLSQDAGNSNSLPGNKPSNPVPYLPYSGLIIALMCLDVTSCQVGNRRLIAKWLFLQYQSDLFRERLSTIVTASKSLGQTDNLRIRFDGSRGEPGLCLTLRRKWVVAIGVPLTNSTVLSMNVQLGFLFPCELSRGLDCFALSVEPLGYAIGAGLPHGPFSIPRNDMLCFPTHVRSVPGSDPQGLPGYRAYRATGPPGIVSRYRRHRRSVAGAAWHDRGAAAHLRDLPDRGGS